MNRERAMQLLTQSKPELIARYGITRLALFGSVARGEATDESDVDVVVKLDADIVGRGLDYFSSLALLKEKLEAIVGKPVDIVSEPIQKPRLAKEIDRDREFAF